MDWIVPAQNAYIKIVIPSALECDRVGDKTFKDVTDIKWDHTSGP